MIDVNYNEYKETLEENMRLIPENHKLKEEIRRLNKIIEIKNNRIQQLMKRTRSARIDKAIEYIKQNCDIEKNYYPYIDTRNIDIKYLLDILKGSDKE